MKNSLHYLTTFFLLLLAILMAFPYGPFQQWVSILAVTTWVIDWIVNRQWLQWRWTPLRAVYALSVVFCLLVPLWWVIGVEPNSNIIPPLERYLPFFFFGLIGLGNTRSFRVEYAATVMLLVMAVKIIWIGAHIDLSMLFSHINSNLNVFNVYRQQLHFSHMPFNLYANMAFVLGYVALIRRPLPRWWRIVIGILMVLCSAAVLISEGRTGVFSILLLYAICVLYHTCLRSKRAAIGVLAAAILVLAGMTIHLTKSRNMEVNDDPRVPIYSVSWQLIQEKPILGYGPTTAHDVFVNRGQTDDAFVNQYIIPVVASNPEFQSDVLGFLHPHNSFMQIWLQLGVIGLLVFIGCLLGFVVHAPQRMRIGALMMVVVFSIQAFLDVIGNDVPAIYLLLPLLFVHFPDETPEANHPSSSSSSLFHITFDAKRYFHNQRGLGNYSRDVVRLLREYAPAYQLDLLDRTGLRRIMPIALPEQGAIYHGLSGEIPWGMRQKGWKTVVTIHDCIYRRYPHLYSPTYRWLFDKKVAYAVRHADLIIAISEQTKQDIIRYYHADTSKIRVVYQGCNAIFRQPAEPIVLDKPYILQVGAIEERKQLQSTIQAVAQLNYQGAVVAIGQGGKYLNECQQLAERLGVDLRIEHPSFSDFPRWYKGAQLSVYPSQFEGFGIPILESMCVGTPVVTSQGSCFAEVGGKAALYADPQSIDDLAHCIDRVLHDSSLREQMVHLGYNQAQLFCDDQVSQHLLQVYSELQVPTVAL